MSNNWLVGVLVLVSYVWLLKVSWTQGTALVAMSQENTQLRIRLFACTALLAKKEDAKQRAELSEEIVQKSRSGHAEQEPGLAQVRAYWMPSQHPKLALELMEQKKQEPPLPRKTARPTPPPQEEEEELPPPPKCVATFEFDKKRVGGAYSSVTASSANRCKRLCLADEDCQAWVFVHQESECELMLHPGDSLPHKCCVSGLRCG
ncbi:hypothetical protein BASA81_018094 [Batrachochytrium salamandrivorans]|nr:hypothetical protein BASA81_018094 [Batrachochytrium salamandrivorans]